MLHSWLVRHNWLSIRRSPGFHRALAVNLFFGFIVLIVTLELVLVGFFLNRMIREDILPGADPLTVVNSWLMAFFGIDFLLRFNFQKMRSVDARHYMLLNVRKNRIARFLLLKTLLTLLNLFPLLILVPFFFREVIVNHPAGPATAWFLAVVSILLINTYLTNYLHLRFVAHPVQISLLAGALVAIVVLEKFSVISLTDFSGLVFNSVLSFPVLVLIPLSAMLVIYGMNFRYLTAHIHVEDLFTVRKKHAIREQFRFLTSFGELGTLMSLDLKLMLRNKRARVSLWMPFLFVFYGLFFYPGGQFNRADFVSDYFLIFAGAFITGFFIMSYGLMTFCYESRYFGLILTKPIDMFSYLKARYYFMLMMAIPVYLISLFYLYFGSHIVLINSMMFLFNLGVTPFFFLFVATYNKMKFDMNAGLYSMQGKGSNQFLAVFLLMGLLLIFFLPFRAYMGREPAFLAFGVIGLAGFVFHTPLLKLILNQFYRRRYVMSEGFRHS